MTGNGRLSSCFLSVYLGMQCPSFKVNSICPDYIPTNSR